MKKKWSADWLISLDLFFWKDNVELFGRCASFLFYFIIFAYHLVLNFCFVKLTFTGQVLMYLCFLIITSIYYMFKMAKKSFYFCHVELLNYHPVDVYLTESSWYFSVLIIMLFIILFVFIYIFILALFKCSCQCYFGFYWL